MDKRGSEADHIRILAPSMSVLSGTSTLESYHDSEGLPKVHRDTTQPATTLNIYIYPQQGIRK